MIDSNTENRRARVFISCGQAKHSEELETAHRIRDRLYELGFDPYIAVEEQTLSGLKENLFRQLQRSEYFVFVDFKREKLVPAGSTALILAELQHRGSLFSHQELALASFLDLPLLAFQEKGVKEDDGVLRFLQANAKPFTDRNLLPNVIADEVTRRNWNPRLRNELILERENPTEYFDHAVNLHNPPFGVPLQKRRFYYVNVRNLHDDKVAMNCYAYLEKAIRTDRPGMDLPFRPVELKWSGYTLPNAHIVPQTTRPFDAIAIFHNAPTNPSLVTFSDSMGFGYLPVDAVGEYELRYAVVSDNFPIVRASFTLSLSPTLDQTTLTLNSSESGS